MILAAVLLVALLAALAWMSWRDLAEYAQFKTFTDTRDRRRIYRSWLAKGFALFVVASLAVLALLGRLHAVVAEPPEFGALTRQVRSLMPISELMTSGVSSALLGGLVGGVLLGGVLAGVAARRNSPASGGLMIGDFSALLPRNGAETALTTALSINAGIGEELFFRLLLPLLAAAVTGDAAVAFAVATIAFGLAHIYQGWVGVAGTTLIGAVLASVYLATGELWIAMVAHAGLDLLSLVVRPTIARAIARRPA